MAVDVFIGGLDAQQTKKLETTVRQTIGEIRARDVTVIAVLPSDARNRWDVGVRHTEGWSVAWFDSSVEELPSRVAHALRQSSPPARTSRE
jgi:hypothetical protein